VIEVFIEEDFRFIHTSDVEGLIQEEQSSFIIENQPSMIILDGPLSYIPNFLKEEKLEKSLNNIINVIKKIYISCICSFLVIAKSNGRLSFLAIITPT
jgi:predicted metallo-beta-lactamase superfamily hydrolase